MNWIRPFTTTRAMAPGEILFRKGDAAHDIIFIMSGSLRIPELGIEISPGDVVGELGMLSPDKSARNRRCVSMAGKSSSSATTRYGSCSFRIRNSAITSCSCARGVCSTT